MKEIRVGAEGQFTAIVSDEDYRFLLNWPWTFARSHPSQNGGKGELIYARRGVVVLEKIEGLRTPLPKRFDLFMHHVVLARAGFPAPPVDTWTADHVNHATLDNRRENLRWASAAFQTRRQRHRRHSEFVRQWLADNAAAHTLPFIPDAPLLALAAGHADRAFQRVEEAHP